MCGMRLARAGFEVTIFDERLVWEKPCGGGLTHKAIARYPFLLHGPEPKKLVHSIELMAGRSRTVLTLDQPIVIYSRAVLNGLLLQKAAAAGCELVRSRVTRAGTASTRVRVTAGGAIREFDFAVIAAGARNALLPETQRLERGDLEMTVGYFIPREAERICIKFLHKFEGYLWSFPRNDHLSVGICGRMARHTSEELSRLLRDFVQEQGLSAEGGRFYSHILPSPQIGTLRQRRIGGRNWALAGDAAGLVDPVTGEGLYYAMRSGELLAESLIAGRPEQYAARVRADFSGDLEFAAAVVRRVYRGRFLGSAITTRMIQFAGRSPAFRAVIRDLMSGTQDYASLKTRLWSQVGLTLGEVLTSFGPFGTARAASTEF